MFVTIIRKLKKELEQKDSEIEDLKDQIIAFKETIEELKDELGRRKPYVEGRNFYD